MRRGPWGGGEAAWTVRIVRAGPHVAGTLAWLALSGCADPRDGATWSGTIEAVEVDVVPDVAGRIVARAVDQGDAVRLGQRVASLDAEPYRIALAEAEAALAEAQARARLLESGYRSEEIDEAGHLVRQAQAALAQAQARLSRVEELTAEGVAPRDDLDLARRDRDAAGAALAAAQARHARASHGYRADEVAQARAEARRLEAVVAGRKLDLTRTEVLAPLDGTVTEKLQEPGEYARPGSPIVAVADLSQLYTWVYPTALELPRIHLGDAVVVRVDAYPDRDFPGRVVYISPEAEFTPKNVQTAEDRAQLVYGVKVAVANPDGVLKVGIPADVRGAP
jgi:HlyD family secretion protein